MALRQKEALETCEQYCPEMHGSKINVHGSEIGCKEGLCRQLAAPSNWSANLASRQAWSFFDALVEIMARRLATKNILLIVAGVLVVTGAVAAGALYVYWDRAVPLAGMAINYVRYLSAPAGTLVTEKATSKDAEPPAASDPPAPGPVPAAPLVADQSPGAATGNWPSSPTTRANTLASTRVCSR